MLKTIRALLLVLLLSFSGCMTPLDREWHEVNTQFRQANRVFAELAEAYAKAADEMARKKHELQRLHIERDWEHFLSIHTQDGRLVSLNANGEVVPMSVADMDAAMKARNDKLAALEASKASWASLHGAYGGAVDKFVVSTELTGMTEEEVFKAKESAQQLLDSLLSAIAGIAIALGAAA